jgi:hypothetical protein
VYATTNNACLFSNIFQVFIKLCTKVPFCVFNFNEPGRNKLYSLSHFYRFNTGPLFNLILLYFMLSYTTLI